MENNEFGEVISSYTDREAVEDGVLVPWDGPGKVNRITRAVFDTFTTELGSSPITGSVTDISELRKAVGTMLERTPDEGGWRTGKYREWELWLLPNEIGGLTLMFPSDY
jgi:hypothetical protein